MNGTWVTLKQGPMSSHWRFAGVRNGWEYWRSRNGKLFRTDKKIWQQYRTNKP